MAIWPFSPRARKRSALTTAQHDGSPVRVPVAINPPDAVPDPNEALRVPAPRPLPTDIQAVWAEVNAPRRCEKCNTIAGPNCFC